MLSISETSPLQLVICADEVDAKAFREAGLKSVRVVDCPESLFAHGDSELELDDSLSIFSNFILGYPLDQAELRDEVAMRLGDVKCRWLDLTDDLPTPASLLRELGKEALANAVVTAKPMWTDEVCTMDDVPEPGPQISYITGIKGLDDHGFRLQRPAFMPVIGPYGSGKSVLLRQLAVSLWRKHGWRTLMTAFEEKIKPRFQRDLRRHLIDMPVEMWTEEDIVYADAEISKAFRFLRRRRGDTLNLDRLLSRIEYAVKVYGVDVVIIDPVNEIDHDVPKFTSKTDYMGQFIMALKALADDYNLLMIVAAHPPKDGVEKRLAKGKLLTLNDGADTSHWGNKADIGWAVWRPDMEGPTLLHIDKLKDYETMGKPTLVELDLNRRFNRFVVTRTGYEILGENVG